MSTSVTLQSRKPRNRCLVSIILHLIMDSHTKKQHIPGILILGYPPDCVAFPHQIFVLAVPQYYEVLHCSLYSYNMIGIIA